MIYKISLITAAALAAVAIGVSDKLQEGVAEASTRLDESKKALEQAQIQETKSAQHLQDILAFYGADSSYDGDISEAKYKEIYDKAQAVYDDMLATRKELLDSLELSMEEPVSLDDAVSREKSYTFRNQCWMAKSAPQSKLNDIERESRSMEREIGYLQRDVDRLLEQEEKGRNARDGQAGNRVAPQGGQATPTPPAPTPPAATPLTPERLDKIIRTRLNFVHADKVNPKALSEVFSGATYQLGGHISYSLKELSSMCKDEVESYSPRAIKVKSVGVNEKENSLEIIMAYVFKGIKKKFTGDRSGYLHITYMVDDKGMIIGMNEVDSETEPSLSPGYTPYQYKGEDTAISE